MRTLEQVLLHETKEFEFVVIRDGGWRIGMTWIDPEDLFIGSLNRKLLDREVKSVSHEKVDGLTNEAVCIDL